MTNKNVRFYSYVNLDLKTVQKLFSKFDTKIKVKSIELITEGLSTTNYIVEAEDSPKKYLLKIYPVDGERTDLEVASFLYAKQFIRVPSIYLYDDSKQICGNKYVIMEYINGTTLKDYIITNKKFSDDIAYDIGRNLVLLHRREYPCRGLLDKELNIKEQLSSMHEVYYKLLGGVVAKHIDRNVKEELLEFIDSNDDLIKELDSNSVFSHGDFYPSNIMIDSSKTVCFIDFEYSLSAPIYSDIGKFFRDRDFDKYRTNNTFDSFAKGYNDNARNKLPDNWIKLSRLNDITSMLSLINQESPPAGWIKSIETSIIHTMKILKNE
ncbi:aminoglycoside phosphotransferase family protein [Clostridiaceae bacterium M8S5]|nr:aminoglycoside phosphotransferase family protein [Clostridiaceae bacterium M8S5]